MRTSAEQGRTMSEAKNKDIKTIHEFLADNPNVDVSAAWERFWGILSGVKDRIAARFPEGERDPSCEGREYYEAKEEEIGLPDYEALLGMGVGEAEKVVESYNDVVRNKMSRVLYEW